MVRGSYRLHQIFLERVEDFDDALAKSRQFLLIPLLLVRCAALKPHGKKIYPPWDLARELSAKLNWQCSELASSNGLSRATAFTRSSKEKKCR